MSDDFEELPDDDWTPPELRVADFSAPIPKEGGRRALYWKHFQIGKDRQDLVYSKALDAHVRWKAEQEAEAAR